MHRESNSVFRLSIIILTTLLSFHLSPSFCRKIDKFPGCNKPFSCGKFKNLSYPFSKNDVFQDCGFPGFELNCNGKIPLLEISQLSFQVLEINFTTYTLKLARQDLSNNICTNNTYNTTLNPKLFEFSPNSGHKIVTLFYNCTRKYNLRPSPKTLPNQFSCVRFGSKSLNLFKTGDPSSAPGPDFSCTYNISVPVNREAARALETPTASSINVLKSALANGFFVRWSTDNEYCEGCRYSRKTALSVVSIPASMPLPVGYMLPTSRAPPPGLTRYVGPTSRAPTPGSGENRNIVATSPAPTPGLGETEGFGPIIQTPVDAPQSDGPSAEPPYDQGEHSAIIGNRVKVTIAIVITGTTILSIIIFVLLKTRSSPRAPTSNQDVENFLVQNGSLAPKRYKYSEIKKITKSFKEKLGQGGYGSVYKGTLANGGQVAVKILIETDSNGEEFINEVASISRTSHVNIVSLLGFCYDRKKGKRALVYEYMPNKSLDTLISNTSSTNCLIDDKKMYEIALGVAKGLEYLHTGCNTRIVHFDIKPQNILLDEDLCPKISDFGLAKLCKKKQSILSVVGTRGTIGYIAPEVFSRNFGGVSHKSDVYSYGMMLLEMAGAKKITGNDDEIQSSENYFPDRLYERVIMNVSMEIDDLEVEEEKEEHKKMFMVGFWCIQTSPSDRPSISKVVEMLEGNIESIQIPPKPVLFAPPVSMLEFSSSYTEYSAEN